MKVFKGTSANGGIAIGRIKVFKNRELKIDKRYSGDRAKEIEKLLSGIEIAKQELESLYDKAFEAVGDDKARIFEVHKMMLEDFEYLDRINKYIKEDGCTAEYAVELTKGELYKVFDSIDDPYMKERAKDIKDISDRLIRVILDKSSDIMTGDEKLIIYAEDLLPSETISLDKDKVLAIVTVKGSTQSHTAILARTMNIPSIVNIDGDFEDFDMKTGIVDAYRGEFIVDPDEKTLMELESVLEKEREKKEYLRTLLNEEAISKDGTRIKIYANIGSPQDVDKALENGAEGIGLFRTEFLYLGKDELPKEEEQFLQYKHVLEKMGDKEVIIRTFDIGADKKVDYLNLPEEENPALGYRAIRICLDRTDLFKEQIRAILRASVYGHTKIMLPMINDLWEVKKAKQIIEEVKLELEENKISYNRDIKIGIMIETPAAALISDILADEVSFFSIGTNDLTQYTLAVDRQNMKINNHRDIHHMAVKKLIEMTIKNAHGKNIEVGVCGELGADVEMSEFFVKNRIDELSVNPGNILELKDRIRKL